MRKIGRVVLNPDLSVFPSPHNMKSIEIRVYSNGIGIAEVDEQFYTSLLEGMHRHEFTPGLQEIFENSFPDLLFHTVPINADWNGHSRGI